MQGNYKGWKISYEEKDSHGTFIATNGDRERRSKDIFSLRNTIDRIEAEDAFKKSQSVVAEAAKQPGKPEEPENKAEQKAEPMPTVAWLSNGARYEKVRITSVDSRMNVHVTFTDGSKRKQTMSMSSLYRDTPENEARMKRIEALDAETRQARETAEAKYRGLAEIGPCLKPLLEGVEIVRHRTFEQGFCGLSETYNCWAIKLLTREWRRKVRREWLFVARSGAGTELGNRSLASLKASCDAYDKNLKSFKPIAALVIYVDAYIKYEIASTKSVQVIGLAAGDMVLVKDGQDIYEELINHIVLDNERNRALIAEITELVARKDALMKEWSEVESKLEALVAEGKE